jgi:two-component system, OmpR family, clock-associated histidine kinase SasA
VRPSVDEAIRTVQSAATAKQVSLSSEVPGDMPPAHADPDRLLQILVNLLENGVKFTPRGGKVTLSVDAQREAKNSVLRFRVTDSGCGINPEDRERIFERLYQVAGSDGGRNGLGLGLYICKELVKLQGGKIWVESSSPQGSTFCFTLPIHRPSQKAAPN